MFETQKKHSIVLADDDSSDRELFNLSFKKNGFTNFIYNLEDGEQLLHFLNYSGNYKKSRHALPCLILLDLNMPKKNGFEALKEIKENDRISHLPVVIFTTSNDQNDINQAYLLGANAFVTKPSSFSELSKVVESLAIFWLNAVELPLSN